ncbi:secretory phospholipase A2 receptor isoform X2 [Ambystoma mexicanum]|uniref:secretory phospholipase A2 receptor isoform X2 n=1 Tax=Ambystoma mexicanum TaxID=8296 RepID=UPI0037E76C53
MFPYLGPRRRASDSGRWVPGAGSMLRVSLARLALLLAAALGAAGGDATLSQDQLSDLFGKGMFIMKSEYFSTCIRVDSSGIVLANCSQPSVNMLWKWVSRHRLFNLGSNHCLGINAIDQHPPLGMYDCDSQQHTLWWNCQNDELASASSYKLAVENGQPVPSRLLSHTWKHYTTHAEGLCAHPFQEMYTLGGNSFGAPCVFPFQFKNVSYSACTTAGRDDGKLWCSTSSNFDKYKKFGFCPSDGSGCSGFWEKSDIDGKACYQFNLVSMVSWSKARASCQEQGGDLLSINDLSEQTYISHISGGPLSDFHCGTFSTVLGSWQSFQCEAALPYICKKYLNHTEKETFDLWKYYPTQCGVGWFPYNRNCYKLQMEKLSWKYASSSCNANGSQLMSIGSLAEVELLVSLLEDNNVTEAWLGLISNTTKVVFQWSDGSPVTLTDWHKREPIIIHGVDQICVSAQGKDGHWSVRKCEDKMVSICKKAGHVQSVALKNETQCEEDWERHGGFCYTIDNTSRTFERAFAEGYCFSLRTVTNRFEQAFLTSMINSMMKSQEGYFWIALQDANRTGEYRWKKHKWTSEDVTYTNWNKHQPSQTSGCIAMRSGSASGRWEVKDCQNFKAMSVCKQPLISNENNRPSEFSRSEYFYKDLCIHGWESDPHIFNCFKVFHSEKVLTKKSWDEAEDFCQAYGGHLASFSHIDEEIFLDGLLNTMFHKTERRRFWIGLSKRSPSSGGSWEWSDGSPVVSLFVKDMYTDNHATNCASYKADNLVVPLNCDSKLEWICKIQKGVIPKTPEWHVKDAPWTFFQGAEYLFFEAAGDFHGFRFACGWLGGRLLAIHSPNEQKFIASRLKKFSKHQRNWWIGLLAENPGDQFRWEDGVPLVYQNWDKETNRTIPVEETRCGYISSSTGLWGDEDCAALLPGICKSTETYKIEKEIPRAEPQQGECPKGWLYFGKKCFLVENPKNDGEENDWLFAHTYCKNRNGELASINNRMEQAFITMQLFGHKSSIWIAQQRTEVNSESGAASNYSNWSPVNVEQQGDDGHTSEVPDNASLCTLMSNNHNLHTTGKWYLDDCSRKGYGFVCEKPQDTSKLIIPASEMYPLPDVLEYGNRTYRIIRGNVTWTEALNLCMENGTQLVSIADQYHQAFLTVIVNRIGYPHWIGLTSLNEESDFRWSDGTSSALRSWRDEGSPALGECAYIDTNGDWSADECETVLRGAVCHVLVEQKTSEDVGKCPETEVPWIQFESKCYSLSNVLNKAQITEAHAFCRQQGSNLLVLEDEEENTFLVQQLHAFHSSVVKIWLSITHSTENNTITWHDKSPLHYTNWGSGQPDWDSPSYPCSAMAAVDGKWWAVPCVEKNGFICKRHAVVDEEETMHPVEDSNHGLIPLAVIVSIIILILASFVWCVHKKIKSHSWRIPLFRTVTNTPGSNLEETILISELETNHF